MFRVPQSPDGKDRFQYRFVARAGGTERVLFRGRTYEGRVLAAPVPEFSPAVEGYTLTYYLMAPSPVRVTLQVWDPVIGANLFSGGRWVTAFTRDRPDGRAERVTESIPRPFDPFDVGRESRYRLLVSYGGEPIEWRLSAPFVVNGTSWLTYGMVMLMLLLGGSASAALWPLIRARARLQEELRLAEVRSRERQHGMTLLANKIGHEAEAWMASIRWLNALLRREVGERTRSAEYVVEMERATEQLGAYLRRLKEYGRPPSPTRAVLRVSDLLRIARLRADPALQAAGVTVSERIAIDGWLLGDESEIVAAIGNLIQNAAEAMARTPDRTLTLSTLQNEQGELVIELRDTGHGIPSEVADTLFDPFRSTRGEGRGLGLAIARKNVEAHGGTVSFRREPVGGTTFTVTFPCQHGAPKGETADGAALLLHGDESAAQPDAATGAQEALTDIRVPSVRP
jgi:signal transduction histidine kinase